MEKPYYYVPHHSAWPITAATAVFLVLTGFINYIHENSILATLLGISGIVLLSIVLFGWFGRVIYESHKNLYSSLSDRSFRWGMVIFILSEVMFFATFFGALLYAREFVVPWLGGLGIGHYTNTLLWPEFSAAWPLLVNPDPSLYPGPKAILSPWGIPLLNTVLLLSSACTLTWAHWALKLNNRMIVSCGLTLTIVLGLIFLGCQTYEYYLAHFHDGLTMSSGIFGSTFFMLTGFHGLHVTVGLIMLITILVRILRGHFNKDNHFGFEACAWYWHFVDVVWLFLFVFVYWI